MGVSANWTTIAARSFSSWASRRNIHPILDFQHLLAQLQFKVEPGTKEAGALAEEDNERTIAEGRPIFIYDEDKKLKQEGQTGKDESPAVKVKAIRMMPITDKDGGVTQAIANKFSFSLTDGKISGVATDPKNEGENVTYTLMQNPSDPTNDKKLEDLTEQYLSVYDGNSNTDAVAIGAGMLFLPWKVDGTTSLDKLQFEVDVEQLCVHEKGLESGEAKSYIRQTNTLPVTLKASDIKIQDGTEQTIFNPGTSYTVTFVINHFAEIKIYASLTAWKDGGSGSVDGEDQFWPSTGQDTEE